MKNVSPSNYWKKRQVDWIKNSSGGWAPGATPATVEDIRFIKVSLKGYSRVKASGGINTRATALALLEAGAELLGTSHGAEIIDGESSRGKPLLGSFPAIQNLVLMV